MMTEQLIERLRSRAADEDDLDFTEGDAALMEDAVSALRTALAQLDEARAERDVAIADLHGMQDGAAIRDERARADHWMARAEAAEARLEEAKAVLDASHTELSCLLANPDDFSVDKWPVENPADAACLAAAYGPMRAFLHQGGEDAR